MEKTYFFDPDCDGPKKVCASRPHRHSYTDVINLVDVPDDICTGPDIKDSLSPQDTLPTYSIGSQDYSSPRYYLRIRDLTVWISSHILVVVDRRNPENDYIISGTPSP